MRDFDGDRSEHPLPRAGLWAAANNLRGVSGISRGGDATAAPFPYLRRLRGRLVRRAALRSAARPISLVAWWWGGLARENGRFCLTLSSGGIWADGAKSGLALRVLWARSILHFLLLPVAIRLTGFRGVPVFWRAYLPLTASHIFDPVLYRNGHGANCLWPLLATPMWPRPGRSRIGICGAGKAALALAGKRVLARPIRPWPELISGGQKHVGPCGHWSNGPPHSGYSPEFRRVQCFQRSRTTAFVITRNASSRECPFVQSGCAPAVCSRRRT